MNPLRPVPLFLSLLTLFALLVGSALAVSPVSAAGDIEVANNNNDGDGSLRKAIADISPGRTITFSPSLSGQTILLTSRLGINENLIINGSGLASPVTISGNSFVGVFTIGPEKVVILDSLKIINGNNEMGGGILNLGELTIINSTISGNTADLGGGIFNSGNAFLKISHSALSNNTADGDGGGIYNQGELTIINSTLSGNNAQFTGGGIFNMGDLTILNSTLSGNTSVFGGGISNEDSQRLNIINSTLSENTAEANGGGIDNSGDLFIENSTLYKNTASSFGGILNREGILRFENTIIAGSTGGDCYNIATIDSESTHNLVQDGSCFVATNLDGDPKLGPLADNGGPTLTHALLPGSPAIDAGSDPHCPEFDQRGIARPYGDGCDIGAFEFHPDHPYIGFIIYLPLITNP